MTNGNWVKQTIEEFCVEKMLEGQKEETCNSCGEVTPFWVLEFGGLLCIECAHSVYSDYMHEMYQKHFDIAMEALDE